jgi:uncharacterized membrane protein
MSYDPEPEIEAYLKRLDSELRALPRDRRREVVGEIADHIAQARAAAPVESEGDLLNLLERLGPPSEIAAEASDRFGTETTSSSHEIAAVILLLLGGFVFGVGWIVGVVLLWTSRIWTLRDKLIGTLLLPGGLAFSLVLLFGVAGSGESCVTQSTVNGGGAPLEEVTTCSGDSSGSLSVVRWAILVLVLVLPLLTTGYLSWRLKTLRREGRERPATGSSNVSAATVTWIVVGVVVLLTMFAWLASQTLIPANQGS